MFIIKQLFPSIFAQTPLLSPIPINIHNDLPLEPIHNVSSADHRRAFYPRGSAMEEGHRHVDSSMTESRGKKSKTRTTGRPTAEQTRETGTKCTSTANPATQNDREIEIPRRLLRLAQGSPARRGSVDHPSRMLASIFMRHFGTPLKGQSNTK